MQNKKVIASKIVYSVFFSKNPPLSFDTSLNEVFELKRLMTS